MPRQVASMTLAFILMSGVLSVTSHVAAQAPPKPARIGYLSTGALETPESRQGLDAFRRGLRERGYIEGEHFVLELRSAGGDIERLPALARELVSVKVDLILAGATPGARAARNATTTIPIVAPSMGDPVRDELVASLARPGGNLTGSTFLGPELTPKRIEILKEALPRVSRVAALWHPGAFSERTTSEMLREAEAAARRFGLKLQRVEARVPDEIDIAFATMTRERAEALITFPSTMLFSERRRIVHLAAKHRLPAVFNAREFVNLGGLVAYGASIYDLQRRAGIYAAEILKGARPADLPIEQPTTFDLSINLKTAKALGLTIPPSLLLRANHVVE